MELMEWSDGKLEERLDRIDKDFARVDERLIAVNARISELARETNRRFDLVDRALAETAKGAETSGRFEQVDRRFEQVDRRFEQVDRRFDEVDRRITEGREETKERFDRVEAEIAVLRAKLDRIVIGLVLGFPAVIATILAKGG